MTEFLDQYRYLALCIGTFFEGETAILVASSLIHDGVFDPSWLVVFAFLGSFASDWLYYLIGRLNGKYFISRRPRLQARFDPLQRFFNRHQFQVLLTYRFLYGFRILIPLMVGMSAIRPGRYLLFSFCSGLAWAIIVSAAGYSAGRLFGLTAGSFEDNLGWIVLGFATFGMLSGFLMKEIVDRKLQSPRA